MCTGRVIQTAFADSNKISFTPISVIQPTERNKKISFGYRFTRTELRCSTSLYQTSTFFSFDYTDFLPAIFPSYF